jgi:hypothetical protein
MTVAPALVTPSRKQPIPIPSEQSDLNNKQAITANPNLVTRYLEPIVEKPQG